MGQVIWAGMGQVILTRQVICWQINKKHLGQTQYLILLSLYNFSYLRRASCGQNAIMNNMLRKNTVVLKAVQGFELNQMKNYSKEFCSCCTVTFVDVDIPRVEIGKVLPQHLCEDVRHEVLESRVIEGTVATSPGDII